MTIIPNASGVYCLKTTNTKLLYIGSSKNLRIRRNLHTHTIKKRDFKRASSIINSIDNGDTYLFEILELCDNFLEREQYWIDFYKDSKEYILVNVFDANRAGSRCSDEFRAKMSKIRKEKWKDPEYRKLTVERLKRTSMTAERLSKLVHCYDSLGSYIGNFQSAKLAAMEFNLHPTSVSAAARGDFRNRFLYKNKLFIYEEVRVLYKLGELLESHQELRVISSQAWEISYKYQEGSTTNQ